MFKYFKKDISQLEKEEIFVIGFYSSMILIMSLASVVDMIIQNYTDVYFDFLLGVLSLLGLIYLHYSHNIHIAKYIIILIGITGSYIFLVTSNFSMSIFIVIGSLSFFFIFSLKHALIYSIIHQLITAFLYFYGYITDPTNPNTHDLSAITATFIASILMILLGIVYHISVVQSYQKLSHSNRQKEMLLRELHHRVKNNLQIILSLIQLQGYQSNEKELFMELENRIDAIAKIYSLLIIHDNLEYINAQHYISLLLQNIRTGFLDQQNPIEVKATVQASIPLKEATYIGLIINELITNAYKHAFDETINPKIIEIYLGENNGYHLLTIKDNGKGFSPDEKRNSLGLGLVYKLVEQQLEGSIHCDSKGKTEYHICF